MLSLDMEAKTENQVPEYVPYSLINNRALEFGILFSSMFLLKGIYVVTIGSVNYTFP